MGIICAGRTISASHPDGQVCGWATGAEFRVFALEPAFDCGERIALKVEIQTPWVPDRYRAQLLLSEMGSAAGANFLVKTGVSEKEGKGLFSAFGSAGVYWVPQVYARLEDWHSDELLLSRGVMQIARELMSPNLGRRRMEALALPAQVRGRRSFWSAAASLMGRPGLPSILRK